LFYFLWTRVVSGQVISDENGFFDGQRGYGYVSLEKFVDAAREVSAGRKKAEDYEHKGLPTVAAV
jgi:D-galacturonate reductase